jgi:hypothetical protein
MALAYNLLTGSALRVNLFTWSLKMAPFGQGLIQLPMGRALCGGNGLPLVFLGIFALDSLDYTTLFPRRAGHGFIYFLASPTFFCT